MPVTVRIICSDRWQNTGPATDQVTLVFLPDRTRTCGNDQVHDASSLYLNMRVRPEVAALFPYGGRFTLTLEPEIESTTDDAA